MTTSTVEQTSTPQVAVNDIGSAEDFLAAIDETIKYFNDGDIVSGTIVKVDRDEVLLDIGYKTEGVIPSRELSIKHDVDPGEVVSVGDEIEALVLQKEDKEGRLILSKKRAQYERAWGTIEKIKEEDGIVTGTVIEVVKGGLILDIGLRGFLPASLVEMRRVRVSLSLKATQEDPWQQFARTHAIGQVVPGKVTKLVPFGAFVRVDEGIEGLVHISELAERHVEIPEQVVQVGDSIFVKVIDIDLERRRISLSLKQANEGVAAASSDFDPSLYGMAAEYDEQGNYKYPEGFDPESNDWLEGYEKQREEWERQYAEAHARWEAHRKQIDDAAKAENEARGEAEAPSPSTYSSEAPP